MKKEEIIEKLRALKPRARAHKAELVALIDLPDPEDSQPRLWIRARFFPTPPFLTW